MSAELTNTSTVSIRADDLSREFGSITALDGIDVTVEDPEIVGLVGPNGAGKTTLIRCLLGLLGPTTGSSSIDGTQSTDLDRADRARIGYMPQDVAVYRDLTVRENVAFFARLYGVENPGGAIDEALSFVDLRGREDARIGELSGGMVRRTSLACTLVADPDVLFLDEPTVGLDPELRAGMWDRFQERRDAGTLLVVSTHYLGEADNCDRVLFLRDGRVLAFDRPDALLERTDTSTLTDAFLSLLDADGSGTLETDGHSVLASQGGGQA